LAVEEQFYLTWPLILVCLLRLRMTRRQLAGCVAAAAVVFALERFVLMHAGASEMRLYTGLDTRADALLFGCAAAFVFRYRLIEGTRLEQNLARVGWLVFAALSAHLFLGVGAEPRSTSLASLGSYTVVGAVTAVLILSLTASSGGLVRAVLTISPLQYIGKISYGLYLYHYLIFNIVSDLQPRWRAWTIAGTKIGVTALV